MTTLHCPTCKKLVTWQDNPSRPFCSARCKLIDLGEWASENYKISGNHSENTPFSGEIINQINDNQKF